MSDLDLAELRRIAELTRAENLPVSKRLLVELIDRVEVLEAERDDLIYSRDLVAPELRKERKRADRAEARLARVKVLHVERLWHWSDGTRQDVKPGEGLCSECAGAWPCDTIRAVAAGGQDAWGRWEAEAIEACGYVPCGLGVCAAEDGHEGTCAEASGWADEQEAVR